MPTQRPSCWHPTATSLPYCFEGAMRCENWDIPDLYLPLRNRPLKVLMQRTELCKGSTSTMTNNRNYMKILLRTTHCALERSKQPYAHPLLVCSMEVYTRSNESILLCPSNGTLHQRAAQPRVPKTNHPNEQFTILLCTSTCLLANC